MSYTTKNITLKQGEYLAQPVALLDSEGAAVDCTGHTATLSVWSAQGEALSLSEGAGISWDDQASGLLTFEISSADSAALSTGTRYKYALAIERDADSKVKYPVRGALQIVE